MTLITEKLSTKDDMKDIKRELTNDMKDLKSELTIIKWMMGILLAGVGTIIGKLIFFHS